jgi:hypothetical protein
MLYVVMYEISVYWKLVNAQLGRPATARERALCVKQGYDVAYLRAESSHERGAVVESTVALLRDLRESGFGEPQRVAVSSRGDERWRLLAELHRKVEPGEEWAPVSISTYPPFGFAQVGFPRWDTVEITLDHRMSLRELKATLDRDWPEMIRSRFVRRTRPLGSLKVALVHGTSAARRGTHYGRSVPSGNSRTRAPTAPSSTRPSAP